MRISEMGRGGCGRRYGRLHAARWRRHAGGAGDDPRVGCLRCGCRRSATRHGQLAGSRRPRDPGLAAGRGVEPGCASLVSLNRHSRGRRPHAATAAGTRPHRPAHRAEQATVGEGRPPCRRLDGRGGGCKRCGLAGDRAAGGPSLSHGEPGRPRGERAGGGAGPRGDGLRISLPAHRSVLSHRGRCVRGRLRPRARMRPSRSHHAGVPSSGSVEICSVG